MKSCETKIGDTMKLEAIKQVTGTITLKSGLHIGAGNTEMRIGGTDSPVVTHPHSGLPYIPGSSLKGKIRSLLEMRSGLMAKTKGSPINGALFGDLKGDERAEARRILRFFGASAADSAEGAEIGPTRASFADCFINQKCRDDIIADNLAFTEVKSENSIDRIKGVAQHPRFIERVPAGMVFDFAVTIKKMEGDEDLLSLFLEGCRLLELDALGGSGSRGYGRVQFAFADATIQQQFDSTAAI